MGEASASWSTIRRWLAWWVRELHALFEDALRLVGVRKGRSWIIFGRESTTIEREIRDVGDRHVEPTPLPALSEPDWGELESLTAQTSRHVVIAERDAYTTVIRLPKNARKQLHDAVELQLVDRSPLPLDQIAWAIHSVRVEGEHLLAEVTMVKRQLVSEIAGLLYEREWGMTPILAQSSATRVPMTLLSPALGAAHHAALAATAALVVTPVLIILGAWLLTVLADRKAEALQPTAAAAAAHDREARRAERLRASLSEVTRIRPATMILDDIASQLDPGSWLRYAESGAGKKLTLLVDTPTPAESLAELSGASAFTDVHIVDREDVEDGQHLTVEAKVL